MIKAWLEAHLRPIEWIVLALVVAGVAWSSQHVRGIVDEKHQAAAVAAKGEADASACASNEKVTKEAYDALIQNKDTAFNACAAALSMRSQCVPVTDADDGNRVAGAQRESDHPAAGLESRWLRAYEATCKLIQADYHTCVAHDRQCVAAINGVGTD